MYDLYFHDVALTTFMLFRQAHDATYKVGETELAGVGLTSEKFAVLCACKAYPQPVTLTEIARLLFRAKPSIAEMLTRMEKEGLVNRVPRSGEHAFKEITLTTRGKQAYERGAQVMKALIEEFSSPFSVEQQKLLQDALRVVRDKALERLNLEASPVSALPQGEAFPLKW